MVIKFGKWLTRHKAVVLIIAFLLLIPATIGYVSTRINYDLLSYLPNSLETVSGQDTMVDEFGMGAFSMIVVEDMEKKDIVALKEKLKKVNRIRLEKMKKWVMTQWILQFRQRCSRINLERACLMGTQR